MLVTIEQAKSHLRIDGDYDDQWLKMMIPAVSQAVLLWIKDEARAYQPELDSNGEPVIDSNGDPEMQVKSVVQVAVLTELASQYRFRDGVGVAAVPSNWGHGYTLSMGATALLVNLRKSTVS